MTWAVKARSQLEKCNFSKKHVLLVHPLMDMEDVKHILSLHDKKKAAIVGVSIEKWYVKLPP